MLRIEGGLPSAQTVPSVKCEIGHDTPVPNAPILSGSNHTIQWVLPLMSCASLCPQRFGSSRFILRNYRWLKLYVALMALAFVCDARSRAQTNEWTWMAGNETVSTSCGGTCRAAPIYGAKGQPALTNTPGGRIGSAVWTDVQGNLWLFGGFGSDSAGTAGNLNDLWKFDPSNREWVWQGGPNTISAPCPSACGNSGSYGVLGVFAVGNLPGGRDGGASWTDSKGNFWLFGGEGYDSSGNYGWLNDLWEFNPSLNQWAWIGGSKSNGNACRLWAYTGETLCVQPSAAGSPGGRLAPMTWTDSSGNFWLFGGMEIDSSGKFCGLDDLWKFNPLTGQWRSQGGATLGTSDQAIAAVYGVPGKPQAGQTPGGRWNGRTWTDTSGNLWLFGGANWFQTAVGDPAPLLNDLWKFSPQLGQWAWMGGTQGASFGFHGSEAVYGDIGIPAITNIPGGRVNEVSWRDAGGNFWLSGGFGQGAGPTDENGLNDLWVYSTSANEWTWMGGSNSTYTPQTAPAGVYGTLGVPAPGNLPGTREFAVSWTDTDDNFWLFGGKGVDSAGNLGYLDDLWEYAPPSVPAAVPGFKFYAPLLPYNPTTYPTGNISYGFYVFTGGGFNSPIALDASGLPTDSTATFNPNPMEGQGAFQMGLALGAGSRTGNYAITVTGTGGSITESAMTGLLVQPPYFLTTADATLGVQVGTQGMMGVTVGVAPGFDSPVALTASGQPNGVSISFAPGSITASQSSTMTVSVATDIVVGTYPITITGSADGVTEQSLFFLNVTTGPAPVFTFAASPTSFTVPASSQASTTLTLTPQNGFTGQVNLTCSCASIPAQGSYALPPFVTVAGDSVTTPFTVYNFSRSAALHRDSHPFLIGISLATALWFIGWGRRRNFWNALLVPLTVGCLGLISSCGGGGGTQSGGQAGGGNSNSVTFNVTVTATSGSIQKATTISVTLK